MPAFKDTYIPSSDGKSQIRVRICTPDGDVRGVVQIAHGIAEHVERYDDFMTFLASNGFAVAANDHLGHGKSVSDPTARGAFCEEDGWFKVVEDMASVHDLMVKEYSNVPYINFGHSMGSFLTRTYIIKYPQNYDLVILSGTGNQSSALINAGHLIADLTVKTKGYYSDGTTLNNVAFGSYCKKIENPRTAYDWLSVNAENVDRYIKDEMCGFVCAAGLYRDMMSGLKFITKKSNLEKMDKTKPVYFMSGEDDPVGDYGKGVEKAYKNFCGVGCQDVTIRLYPNGRHEMLNEDNREQVYNDILTWIDSKLNK